MPNQVTEDDLDRRLYPTFDEWVATMALMLRGEGWSRVEADVAAEEFGAVVRERLEEFGAVVRERLETFSRDQRGTIN